MGSVKMRCSKPCAALPWPSRRRLRRFLGWLGTALLAVAGIVGAHEALASPQQSDIPKSFAVPVAGYDYVKREASIPMRDGVKLYTVILVPKGAANAPILLTRTPYDASKRVTRNNSPHMLASLPEGDEVFVAAGYIRVFQDVRGKYKSEGDYVMTRPVQGPLNPTGTDHVTDAYDTIDWLVKNTPEWVRDTGVTDGGFLFFAALFLK